MKALPKKELQQLDQIFEALNLNKKDLKVYKALIGLRYATSAQIGRMTSLPRQTVHSILLKLKDVGLAVLSSDSGNQLFVAEPKMLEDVIKNRQAEIFKINKVAAQLVPKLTEQHHSQVKRPTIKFYDGVLGLEHLFNSMLQYFKTPGSTKEYRGFGINTHSNTSINKFLSKFIKQRAKLGVDTKLIIGAGKEDFTKGMEKRLNMSIKHAKFSSQESGLYILENKVYLFSFKDNAGLVIENETLANFLKNIFEDYWERIP